MGNKIYVRDKKELVNLGKKGKIQYWNDWGVYIGHCPMCKEVAYQQTNCVFCGCDFEEPTEEEIKNLKEKNRDYEVSCGNIRLHQVCNSLYKYVDGKLVSHSSLSRNYSKEQLEEMVRKEYGDD